MIAKFKNMLKVGEIEKALYLSNINSNQNHIIFSQLYSFFTKFLIQQQNQVILISQLLHALKTNNWIKRLKYYMLFHFLFCQYEFPQFLESFANYPHNPVEKNNCDKNQIMDWINQEVIEHYYAYLLKFCANFSLYNFCKYTISLKKQDFSNLEIITKGFAALNIIRLIRQIEIKFNKLGRYYPHYKVIIDLFQMYLNDVKMYYNFVKLIIIQFLDNYKDLNEEVLNHGYSLLNEFIQINDKLYTLFYNRYYHSSMKKYKFPEFYILDNGKYKKLMKYIMKNFHKIKVPSVMKKLKSQNQKTPRDNITQDDINFCRHLEKVYQSTQENQSVEKQKKSTRLISNQF